MNCLKYETLLHRWIDGELEEGLSQNLKAHLEKCHTCSENHTQFSKLSDHLGSLPTPEPTRRMIRSTILSYRSRLPQMSFGEWWRSLGMVLRTAICGIAILGFTAGCCLSYIPEQDKITFASIRTDVYMTAFDPQEGGVP